MREPAAKVFSQYVHLWSEGRETLPFEAAFAASEERRAKGFSDMFDYEGGGYYAAAVARYLERFGPERVLVLLFEELTADMDAARGAARGLPRHGAAARSSCRGSTPAAGCARRSPRRCSATSG